MPENILREICEIREVPYPDHEISYLPSNWGASKGGKLGMETLQRRYSEKQFSVWRRKGGTNAIRKGPIGNQWKLKEIRSPELNEELSELIGICLGDGTLTEYFLRIFGNVKYDKPHIKHISEMIQHLFGLSPRLYERERNLFVLEISSKQMCKFLHNGYGLPYGNKIVKKAVIPSRILEDTKLSLACLRGLVDTDGSVSKRGNQISLNFTSRNKKLLEQVWEIGKPFFSYKYTEDVGTNSFGKIVEYFKIVGSSNLKDIVCFSERYKNNKYLYRKDGVDYYPRYNGISLPYKLRAGGLVGQDTAKNYLVA